MSAVLFMVLLLTTHASASVAANSHPVPTAVAFLDGRHGLLARSHDCESTHCRADIAITADAGRSWLVTLKAAGPISLATVPGTSAAWAATANSVLTSGDSGRTWRRVLRLRAAAISFADRANGWVLPADDTSASRPPILMTTDSGRSWQRLASPCREDFRLIAISLATPDRGWVACVTQASTGEQGKEIWQTDNRGRRWQLRGRVHPIGPPEPWLQLGNLPGFGYLTGMQFQPGGYGWVWESRGWLLTTRDGGRLWRKSSLTAADETEARSASLLGDRTGFVLLEAGCNYRLLHINDAVQPAPALARWHVGC